jgi:N-acetylmuramoyl-L-alanine amidase
MNLKECLLVNNDCYKQALKMDNDTPTGIVVHSTGANNNSLRRYVNPVSTQENYASIIQDLGKNIYNNHWNRSVKQMGRQVCVHAFIGLNAENKVETVQTLPFNYCCWGVGSGSKGSYNYNPTARIQFEICEDALTNESYFNSVMKEAQEFCYYLCKRFNLTVSQICSHAEAYKAGYGNGHSDPGHWLSKFGKNMDWFRAEVQKLLDKDLPKDVLYTVQVGSFSNRKNAENLLKRLQNQGYSAYIVTKEK